MLGPVTSHSTPLPAARRFYQRRRSAAPLLVAGLLLAVALLFPWSAFATSRIKDIADFEGVRDNQLVGYGLVVGLNGTGDDLKKSVFTRESLIGMLERLGVNARDTKLDTKNIAAVMVTAALPPFGRQGTRIDIEIAALGDASSLQGGTLLVTPLLGADSEVYAVAQGPLAVGGFSAQGASASVSRGVTTSGRIANGGVVEREVGFAMNSMQNVKITLRNPDLTTAQRIADAINGYLSVGAARPLDPGTVQLTVPPTFNGDTVGLLTKIEQLPVEPDEIARVVVDENSGVIVMGENVRISTVAIAQGNLTIRITETPQVSQPNAFSNTGTTTTVPRTNIQVDEQSGKKLAMMPAGVTLQELVNGLNALGVGPRDMISILRAIKAAGALQADIQVR